MLCLGCACGTVTWFRLCGLPRKATIEWIEAADYYTGLHVGDRTLMLRESITDLAAKLDPATFRRVHRSAIVNMNYVAEIYREGLDEGTVVLLNGQRLKMSKTGRFKLTQLARLSQLSEVGQEVDKGVRVTREHWAAWAISRLEREMHGDSSGIREPGPDAQPASP